MNEVKRPSLIAAARRGVEANRQAKPAGPPQATPAPAKHVADVAKASCGHDVAVGPGKPAFAAEPAKKLAANPCPNCEQKAQLAREATE